MRANRGRLLQLLIAGALVLAAPIVLGAAGAGASIRMMRVGTAARLPSRAHVLGAASTTQRLRLTIALQPRNAAALHEFATAVSTPGSPEYGHFLTVGQFAQRFGATAPQIQAVRSALRAQGMSVGSVTANHLTIPVSSTVAQAERAFTVSESRVRLAGGRTAYANRQAPTLPSGVASYVQGVIGLDDVAPDQPVGAVSHRGPVQHLARARSVPHVNTNGGPQPCQTAIEQQGNGGLTADEVATAYQFSSFYGAGDFGQGQTIALFEEQAYNPTDIATYQACYGTSATVTPITIAGGPPAGTVDDESALDIEQVIGLAPKANIDVYQGPESSTVSIISAIVSQDVAKVISSSYGVCEALTGGATINAENTLLQEAAAQGQSFFISSGDSGSSMCYQAQPSNTSLSVIDPGGQPFATGVGGTTLFTMENGNDEYYAPGDTVVQSVWNDGDSGGRASGSGGGISSSFPMPSYQSSAPASLGVINANSSPTPCGATTDCREVPDVSADADPNTGYVVFSAGSNTGATWNVTGGTSAAAPLWAAFTALVNDTAACRGLPIGFANPSLYSIAGSSYNNNFSDITLASPFTGDADNDALGVNGGKFPLATGYDMATGLGSMIAPQLAASLCALRAPVYTVSVASPGNQLSVKGRAVGLAIHAADSGGAGLGYGASGLPAGLAINPATGVISGTPTTDGSTTVTVSAGDAYANGGSTSFAWTVVTPGAPKAKSEKLAGLGAGHPKLTFGLSAGSFAPALKSVTIKLPGGLKFATKPKALAKGITIRSGSHKVKFRAKLKHGALAIAFKSPVTSASVSIVRPAITISAAEAAKIRHHKVKKLIVPVKATDTSNHTTGFSLTIKKLS
jgi:Pro-kumamolisin, activation domain/Putative Ig domain